MQRLNPKSEVSTLFSGWHFNPFLESVWDSPSLNIFSLGFLLLLTLELSEVHLPIMSPKASSRLRGSGLIQNFTYIITVATVKYVQVHHIFPGCSSETVKERTAIRAPQVPAK